MDNNLKNTNFGFLRFMAMLEGTSLLLLLFVAVPLKRMMEMPEAVSIIGPIHGALFILFNIILFWHVVKGNLSAVRGFIGFVASLIPFGTFIYKAKVLKNAG